MEYNFLFSSVTFLQLYMPMLVELKRRKEQGSLIINLFWRSNRKIYVDPVRSRKKWEPMVKDLVTQILPSNELNRHSGVIICVDGDIYGPKESSVRESMLYKLPGNIRNKFLIISLIENLQDVVYVKVYLEGDFPADFKRLRKMAMDRSLKLTEMAQRVLDMSDLLT